MCTRLVAHAIDQIKRKWIIRLITLALKRLINFFLLYALTKQVNNLKSELREIKNEKKDDKYYSGNKYLCRDFVLTITRIIVTIVINVSHQLIWHVDVTHQHRETKSDNWCWVPSGQ